DLARLAHGRLTFNSPLDETRADDLVAALELEPGASVLDLGCGWGELMLRTAELVPQSTADGADLGVHALRRGRAEAERRGLGDRVRFHHADVTSWSDGHRDAVVCIGTSHAFG